MGFQTRGSRFVWREVLLFVIAAAASIAFLNHENLYLQNGFRFITTRIEPYLLVTGVSYLFLRFAVLAVELRPPRVHSELVRCPKCGQWIDDASAAGRAAHREVEATPQPTRKEVVPVALRRAVDAVRFGTKAAEGKRIGSDIVGRESENVTGRDLVDALNDPAFLDRMRHGPRPPDDRRLKR
jgi:hypothetical protein